MYVCVQKLQYVGQTSPECLLHPATPLNAPFHSPLPYQAEDELVQLILAQHNDELHCLAQHSSHSRYTASSYVRFLMMIEKKQMSTAHVGQWLIIAPPPFSLSLSPF